MESDAGSVTHLVHIHVFRHTHSQNKRIKSLTKEVISPLSMLFACILFEATVAMEKEWGLHRCTFPE